MADKFELYDSIRPEMAAGVEFFERVYAYSVYDPGYMKVVAGKLMEIGRTDVIAAYNEWYAAWREARREELRPCAKMVRDMTDRELKRLASTIPTPGQTKPEEYQEKGGEEKRKESNNIHQKSYCGKRKESLPERLGRLKALI